MKKRHFYKKEQAGFTLVEMSIVLVVMGLVIGGVFVGQDMIESAKVKAQLNQIEKYQTAVNLFETKYNYIPGDVPDPLATKLNFGIIEKVWC